MPDSRSRSTPTTGVYLGGYVGENYRATAAALSLDRIDLVTCARNSFEAPFAEPAERESWLAELNAYAPGGAEGVRGGAPSPLPRRRAAATGLAWRPPPVIPWGDPTGGEPVSSGNPAGRHRRADSPSTLCAGELLRSC